MTCKNSKIRNICYMESNEITKQLTAVAKTLLEIAASLSGESANEPVFPQDAAKKVANGECLKCGRLKADIGNQKFRRGNCPSCSTAIRRRIREERNPELEFTLIECGLLAPSGFVPELDPFEAAVKKASESSQAAGEIIKSAATRRNKIKD